MALEQPVEGALSRAEPGAHRGGHVLGRALDDVSAPVLMRRAIRRAEDGLFTHYMYFTAATVNAVPEVLLVEEQSVVAR